MAAFPVTRYSIVAAIRSERTDVRRSAFDTLVTAYWKPVFKYVRLKWHTSPDDAADLTQGFFLRAFEKDFFAGFDPSRARFRTYLRTCLDRFVSNARKAYTRLKRGGAVTLVPIDFDEAERLERGLLVSGDDCGDRIAHVADTLWSERIFVLGYRQDAEGDGEILAGEHEVHAWVRLRARNVDRFDRRMRMRRAQQLAMQHAGQDHVVGEAREARHLGAAVPATAGLADHVETFRHRLDSCIVLAASSIDS